MEQLGAHRNSRVIWVTHSSMQVCPAEIARVNAAGGCVLWGRVQVRQGRGDRVRVLESRWFHRHSFSPQTPSHPPVPSLLSRPTRAYPPPLSGLPGRVARIRRPLPSALRHRGPLHQLPSHQLGSGGGVGSLFVLFIFIIGFNLRTCSLSSLSRWISPNLNPAFCLVSSLG